MVKFIVRNVDHDEGNVMTAGNVFIPFGHAVADVVATQNEVRHRHGHLTIFMKRVLTAGLFFSVRKGSNFIDIIRRCIRFQGLRILDRLTIFIEDFIAIGIFQGFATVRIDDIVAIFIHFVGTTVTSSISQGNTGITTDIVVIAQVFSSLTHNFAVTVSCNTGSLVFRVTNMQPKGFSQFARELGRRPAYRFASFFSFSQFTINFFNYVS